MKWNTVWDTFYQIDLHLSFVRGQKLCAVSSRVVRNFLHLIKLLFCKLVELVFRVNKLYFNLLWFFLACVFFFIHFISSAIVSKSLSLMKSFNSCLFSCFYSFKTSKLFFLFEKNFINFIKIWSLAFDQSFFYSFQKFFIFYFIPALFLRLIRDSVKSFRNS